MLHKQKKNNLYRSRSFWEIDPVEKIKPSKKNKHTEVRKKIDVNNLDEFIEEEECDFEE